MNKYFECDGCSRQGDSRFRCEHNFCGNGEYMVLGTAPDKLDDMYSIHWKGDAGDLMREVFAANDLKGQLIMTNLLQCYSQKDNSEEIPDDCYINCVKYFRKLFEEVNPKYILAVGRYVPYKLIERAKVKKGRWEKEVPWELLQKNVFTPPHLGGTIVIPVKEPPKFYEIKKTPELKGRYFDYLNKIIQNIKANNLPDKLINAGSLIPA